MCARWRYTGAIETEVSEQAKNTLPVRSSHQEIDIAGTSHRWVGVNLFASCGPLEDDVPNHPQVQRRCHLRPGATLGKISCRSLTARR